ncbi:MULTISPECIES: histidine kinase [unclassified Nonlabens]|uniref:histidine kinase n=1 Tax=unclassified Nonlabens TaxID=2615035 RepID=UPI0038678E61
MGAIIGYIFIGLLVGLVVIQFLKELDRKEVQARKLVGAKGLHKLEIQRNAILQELEQKSPEKTAVKTKAVSLIYKLAASKNKFTLKDIEHTTQQLQNLYDQNIEGASVYKMNFPEKELLNFEPREILSLLIIINEGLHNAAIHSQANYIFNIASIEDDFLHIITHDNGLGYDRKAVANGDGIQQITTAVNELNGDLKLTSTQGNGTVVNAVIPLTDFS